MFGRPAARNVVSPLRLLLSRGVQAVSTTAGSSLPRLAARGSWPGVASRALRSATATGSTTTLPQTYFRRPVGSLVKNAFAKRSTATVGLAVCLSLASSGHTAHSQAAALVLPPAPMPYSVMGSRLTAQCGVFYPPRAPQQALAVAMQDIARLQNHVAVLEDTCQSLMLKAALLAERERELKAMKSELHDTQQRHRAQLDQSKEVCRKQIGRWKGKAQCARRELERARDCVVCLDAARAVMFDCHHIAVCRRCAAKLDSCPLCRADVTQKINVFF